jgi:hypothetical protein
MIIRSVGGNLKTIELLSRFNLVPATLKICVYSYKHLTKRPYLCTAPSAWELGKNAL